MFERMRNWFSDCSLHNMQQGKLNEILLFIRTTIKSYKLYIIMTNRKGYYRFMELNFNPMSENLFTGCEISLSWKFLTKLIISKESQLTLHQVQAWLEGTVYDLKPAHKFLKYYPDIKMGARWDLWMFYLVFPPIVYTWHNWKLVSYSIIDNSYPSPIWFSSLMVLTFFSKTANDFCWVANYNQVYK